MDLTLEEAMNNHLKDQQDKVETKQEFHNYRLSRCQSIYIYILQKFKLLRLCRFRFGIKELADVKMKLDRATEYLDKDFNIKELVVFMKENKANILLNQAILKQTQEKIDKNIEVIA